MKNQQHILECQVLINNCEALYEDSTVQYENIFGAEKKQLLAVKLFTTVLETRQKLLDEMTTIDDDLVQCTS